MDRYRIFNAGSDLHPAAAWAPAEVTHFARTKYLYSQHANVGAEPTRPLRHRPCTGHCFSRSKRARGSVTVGDPIDRRINNSVAGVNGHRLLGRD